MEVEVLFFMIEKVQTCCSYLSRSRTGKIFAETLFFLDSCVAVPSKRDDISMLSRTSRVFAASHFDIRATGVIVSSREKPKKHDQYSIPPLISNCTDSQDDHKCSRSG